MRGRLQQRGIQVLAVAAAYLGSWYGGQLLRLPALDAVLVWMPSGVGLAALLTLGPAVWPGVWLGAAAVALVRHLAPLAAGVVATVRVGELLLAATLLRRTVGTTLQFTHPRQTVWFGGVCAGAALLGGVLGGLATPEIHGSGWDTFGIRVGLRTLGDLTGMLLIAPALLAWGPPPRPAVPHASRAEGLLYAGLLAVGVGLAFGPWVPQWIVNDLPYGLLLFLVWAAYRFDQRAVCATMVALAGGPAGAS
jgi:integral membrane sensor domain MASE1